MLSWHLYWNKNEMVDIYIYIYIYISNNSYLIITISGWQWYQAKLVHLKQSPKASKWGWKSWKSEKESRSSILRYCWDQSEYWEESWRLKETCCHSNSNERPSANVGVKNSPGVLMIIFCLQIHLSIHIPIQY